MLNRYNYEDLNNKKLVIKVAKSVEGTVIVGVEQDTGDIYILRHDVKQIPIKRNAQEKHSL